MNALGLYILKAGNPVKAKDIDEWSRWFASDKTRYLDRTDIGKVFVSTVFLGNDHSFGKGKPVLWETMIFGGHHDQYCKRYTSKKDALAGHKVAVKMVKTQSK